MIKAWGKWSRNSKIAYVCMMVVLSFCAIFGNATGVYRAWVHSDWLLGLLSVFFVFAGINAAAWTYRVYKDIN